MEGKQREIRVIGREMGERGGRREIVGEEEKIGRQAGEQRKVEKRWGKK